MNTKFDYWKCNKMYEKAQLRSDFGKKYLLGWGSNPRKWLLSCSALSRIQACYIEFILVSHYPPKQRDATLNPIISLTKSKPHKVINFTNKVCTTNLTTRKCQRKCSLISRSYYLTNNALTNTICFRCCILDTI